MKASIKKRKKIAMIVIVIIYVVSTHIPMRFAISEDDIQEGYLLRITQTTGPWWRIDEIKGKNDHNLQQNELVYLDGFDPYTRLSSELIGSFQNTFLISVSNVENVYCEMFEDYFNTLTVERWDIVYPIIRETPRLPYMRRFLTIYDYRWFGPRW